MAWSDSKQREFTTRAWNWSNQLRQLGLEAFVLLQTWAANDVADDPAFVDSLGVAKADIAAAIGVMADQVAFLQNGAVTTEDRQLVLARILGGPLQG